MTLFIPHLVWSRDVIIWRYHVISRNLSKTLGIWWSVICGQKIHIRLGTSWSVICGQKIHIYYLVIISRIFRKNLIWGRHGASFVDKKSTVIFTRIICTVFCFSLWFISPTQKNKVAVSESYRFRKLPFLCGRKLPLSKSNRFLGRKLPFFVIKLPFISENYRFGFSWKINGNFDTDKVTVYWYKVTVFSS